MVLLQKVRPFKKVFTGNGEEFPLPSSSVFVNITLPFYNLRRLRPDEFQPRKGIHLSVQHRRYPIQTTILFIYKMNKFMDPDILLVRIIFKPAMQRGLRQDHFTLHCPAATYHTRYRFFFTVDREIAAERIRIQQHLVKESIIPFRKSKDGYDGTAGNQQLIRNINVRPNAGDPNPADKPDHIVLEPLPFIRAQTMVKNNFLVQDRFPGFRKTAPDSFALPLPGIKQGKRNREHYDDNKTDHRNFGFANTRTASTALRINGFVRTGPVIFTKLPWRDVRMRPWKIYKFCLLMALLQSVPGGLYAQVLFQRGVNLTNWFQSASASQIQFNRFTKKDFQDIKSLGCDVIRLPINLHAMTSGAPDYTLDPLFLSFLDQAVDWAEELDIHLILDNHTFDPSAPTDPAIGPVLVKVWSQMADHYKERSDHIYYEVLNEPHDISDATWGSIQQSVIDAIRAYDTSHFIIVGGANYNNYNNLSILPSYTDTRLIYTFHFYDPFLFTHQGAGWTSPSLVPLSGVPFPYRSNAMPAVPNSLKGTWVENAMNGYPAEGTVAKVKQQLDVAVNFGKQRQVPVFCGEFGVHIPNSNNEDRVTWYAAVRNYLNENEIPWTIWDYRGGFGLFEKDSYELFDYDLNIPLLEALGFVVPDQHTYPTGPLTNGFQVYDDFMADGVFDDSTPTAGTLNFYSDDSPKEGDQCIYWTGVGQYDAIGFDFKPNLNLSLMPENDYTLQFWVRGNTTGAMFDIRFMDTKTGDSDHPWRMGKTIDNTFAPWDGEWHQVNIPLKSLEEKGAWDNGWFNPEGKFDWSKIDRLEIVPEYQSLTGISFSFDDIRVSGNEITVITSVEEKGAGQELTIYPNPVVDYTLIRYRVGYPAAGQLYVYNQAGQVVKTFETLPEEGVHEIFWPREDKDGYRLPDGLYFLQRATQTRVQTVKLILTGAQH